MAGGFFLTFEGIDGSGKSTQVRLLAEHLAAKGREVVLTREPGGSPGAEEIRRLLVEGAPERWSAATEILLFTAARRDHLERTIAPALERGQVVICDRFVDSTRAYQGSGENRRRVEALHEMMIGRDPDLTLILDIAPDEALARTGTRGDAEDRFEQNGLAFQTALRTAFHQIAAEDPARAKLIDATGSAEAVFTRILATIGDRLDG
ncbi:dTMP kinase [Rhodobacteraceae bacterium NNCM2]|nr:dTMP kinase [Coraliihabitans acroporae]